MKKVFLLLIAMTLILFLALPAPIFQAEGSSVYESEVPLHTYRGHGGDREEVQQSFEALVKAAQSGEDLQKSVLKALRQRLFRITLISSRSWRISASSVCAFPSFMRLRINPSLRI